MALQIEQQVDVTRHLFTLAEYERICEADVFAPGTHVELIRGVIADMSPIGPEHEASVAYLIRVFNRLVGDAVLVWPQGNAIRLPQSQSRPQPDVAILRWRDDYYRGKRPLPEDVILLIEVSESSLKYDRG